MNSRSQSWSIDITLAVAVFMIAFFLFYGFLNSSSDTKTSSLKDAASILSRQIASENTALGIIDNKEINASKASKLKSMGYEQIKEQLRIEDDFCIYVEDENGNLVLIDDSISGIGSPGISISGTSCST